MLFVFDSISLFSRSPAHAAMTKLSLPHSQAIASSNMIQLNGINADGIFSQARITEQGIEALRHNIARKREGIAALRAMIEKCKKGAQP